MQNAPVFPPYSETVKKLKEYIASFIDKDPSLATKNDPWDWLKVEGFNAEELNPSLFQMQVALSAAIYEHKNK